MFNNEKIETIKDKLDIVDVIREYLPGIKKSGKNYKTLCPFHSEKTPSFTVSQEKQIFYCFGCGEGGDVFKFIMKMENVSFYEAVKKLALKANIQIEELNMDVISVEDREKISLKKIMDEASSFYKNYLKSSNGKIALEYLKVRNIKEETIRNFGLGFSPDSDDALIIELKKKNYSKDLILKSGLAKIREDGKLVDYFRNRIMFPIKNYNGEVIAFGGRTLNNGNPKYLNSSETLLFSKRKILYGLFESLNRIRKDKRILLVEGYMDVITLHQYGIDFTLSSLGTSFTYEQAQLIKRYSDEAFIFFDPDNAGINSAIKAADIMVDNGIYPRIIYINENIDPDEFVIKEGVENLYNIINNSPDIIDFKISLIKNKKVDLKANYKSKIISYLVITLQKQKDDIIRNEWIKKISENFKVSEQAILNFINKNNDIRYKEELEFNNSEQKIPSIEKGFIHFLLKKPSLIKEVNSFNPQSLQSDFAKTLFYEIKENGDSLKIDKLCDRHPQYSSMIMKLYLEDIKSDVNWESNIKRAATMIENFADEKRWKELKSRISSLSKEEMDEFSSLTRKIKLKKGD